jgi:hypothetical protein
MGSVPHVQRFHVHPDRTGLSHRYPCSARRPINSHNRPALCNQRPVSWRHVIASGGQTLLDKFLARLPLWGNHCGRADGTESRFCRPAIVPPRLRCPPQRSPSPTRASQQADSKGRSDPRAPCGDLPPEPAVDSAANICGVCMNAVRSVVRYPTVTAHTVSVFASPVTQCACLPWSTNEVLRYGGLLPRLHCRRQRMHVSMSTAMRGSRNLHAGVRLRTRWMRRCPPQKADSAHCSATASI